MPDEELARCMRELKAQGYAILEGALKQEFCDEILAEIRRLESIGPPALAHSE